MKFFILLVLIGVCQVKGFDYIRDSFRIIDEEISPCDNFYRHACPVNPRMDHLLDAAYEQKLFSLKAKSLNSVWNNLDSEEVLRTTRFKELPTIDVFIGELFQTVCEDETSTVVEKESFLLKVEESMFGFKEGECQEDYCLKPLAHDKNCTRAANKLQSKLILEDFPSFANEWFFAYGARKFNLDGITAILEADTRLGVTKIRDLVQEIVDKLSEWIKETPWAENNDATDIILNTAQQVHFYDNFGISLRNDLNFLLTIEQSYLKCMTNAKKFKGFDVFCMVMAFRKQDIVPSHADFFTYFNAYNNHPSVHFSFLFYDLAQNVEELAGFLGSAGFVAGHEVSHTMIENANHPQIIPYFSNDSMQCIQNQFQTTCDSFKEISCGIRDDQIDENGSDILGLRLAYSIFEKAYGNEIHKEYIQLPERNITMQQLFFYSTAFVACRGFPGKQGAKDPHSPWNIRVNAAMQHPEFRNAFQCDADSEMVKSFADECVIFGKDAPQMRR